MRPWAVLISSRSESMMPSLSRGKLARPQIDHGFCWSGRTSRGRAARCHDPRPSGQAFRLERGPVSKFSSELPTRVAEQDDPDPRPRTLGVVICALRVTGWSQASEPLGASIRRAPTLRFRRCPISRTDSFTTPTRTSWKRRNGFATTPTRSFAIALRFRNT